MTLSIRGRPRTWAGAMPVRAVIAGGIGTSGSTRRSSRATGSSPESRTAPTSTMRDSPGRVPVVSRSKTT